jgi:hypothetical protein
MPDNLNKFTVSYRCNTEILKNNKLLSFLRFIIILIMTYDFNIRKHWTGELHTIQVMDNYKININILCK